MFTIKLYTNDGKQIIRPAQSFHIWRHGATSTIDAFEVTAYLDELPGMLRFDIGPTGHSPEGGNFDYAYIVNDSGTTVEALRPACDRESKLTTGRETP